MYPQSIVFTENVEMAIQDGGSSAIQEVKKALTKNLKQLTSQDFGSNLLEQLKMKALVVDVVHNIDVVSQLLKANVTSLTEWKWRKQLRYSTRPLQE